MTLEEAVRDLATLGDETLYVAEPWTPQSETIVGPMVEKISELPFEAQRRGLTYFIEVFVAREFLEGWVSGPNSHSTLAEKCERLIRYAITDA